MEIRVEVEEGPAIAIYYTILGILILGIIIRQIDLLEPSHGQ